MEGEERPVLLLLTTYCICTCASRARIELHMYMYVHDFKVYVCVVKLPLYVADCNASCSVFLTYRDICIRICVYNFACLLYVQIKSLPHVQLQYISPEKIYTTLELPPLPPLSNSTHSLYMHAWCPLEQSSSTFTAPPPSPLPTQSHPYPHSPAQKLLRFLLTPPPPSPPQSPADPPPYPPCLPPLAPCACPHRGAVRAQWLPCTPGTSPTAPS